MAERGIIYGRASRDPKGGGTSVTKQLERGRLFAKRESVRVIVEIRDDNKSASRGSREREGFAEVRGLIERGQADLLILWEVSRSSRDLEEFMGLVNACSGGGLEIAVSGTRYDLNVPARIVWGVADPFQKLEYGERFARDLGTTVRRIEGGKHFTPEDHPDVIAEEIRSLAAEVAVR